MRCSLASNPVSLSSSPLSSSRCSSTLSSPSPSSKTSIQEDRARLILGPQLWLLKLVKINSFSWIRCNPNRLKLTWTLLVTAINNMPNSNSKWRANKKWTENLTTVEASIRPIFLEKVTCLCKPIWNRARLLYSRTWIVSSCLQRSAGLPVPTRWQPDHNSTAPWSTSPTTWFVMRAPKAPWTTETTLAWTRPSIPTNSRKWSHLRIGTTCCTKAVSSVKEKLIVFIPSTMRCFHKRRTLQVAPLRALLQPSLMLKVELVVMRVAIPPTIVPTRWALQPALT